MGKDRVIVAIVSAFFGSLFTNFDRVLPAVADFLKPPQRLSGKWLGVYRDIKPTLDGQEIVTETLQIKQSRQSVSGTIAASSFNRTWNFTGTLYRDWVESDRIGPFLIINYVGSDNRVSIGAYLLEEQQTNAGQLEYRGYWLGRDPELKKIVACPYVLSHDVSYEKVKARHEAWLNQACAFTDAS